MQLVGMLDSPYVRRVAITMRFLGIEYEHNQLSIFMGYDEFRLLNPLVKIPTLVLDDGSMLVDSTLIIDYLESLSTGQSLVPANSAERTKCLEYTGVALVAMEKIVQLIYETKKRPPEKQHEPWKQRINEQRVSAFEMLEKYAGGADPWLFGEKISHADVSIAVAWRFLQHVFPESVETVDYPALVGFSDRAEKLPEFIASPLG